MRSFSVISIVAFAMLALPCLGAPIPSSSTSDSAIERRYSLSPNDIGSLRGIHFGIPITGGISGGPVNHQLNTRSDDVHVTPGSNSGLVDDLEPRRGNIWDMGPGGVSTLRFGNMGTIPSGLSIPGRNW
ncbi:hypothetical protein QCA50_005026 [Cerrena zonata]|uniref:Uncharacterized protein n=1 Tax=Cerrena zonata TaxID=2478898 RepID=A0AAW0GG82_9APHY